MPKPPRKTTNDTIPPKHPAATPDDRDDGRPVPVAIPSPNNAGNPPPNVSPLTIAVRSAYDLQALRLQIGGRLNSNYKARLGQVAGATEEEGIEDEEDLLVLDELRSEFALLTKGIAERVLAESTEDGKKPKTRRGMLAELPTLDQYNAYQRAQAAAIGEATTPKAKMPLITSFVELCLVHRFLELHKFEQAQFKLLEEILTEHPVYMGYLSKIKGIGPAMAGILLAEIDLSKARYVSSLWAYAGYDVGPDGRGRSRRKEHQRVVQYIDRNGVPQSRNGITYNPTLKTKLYVLATCLLRSGNETYKEVYANYKHRLANHEKYGEHNDGKSRLNEATGKDEFLTSKARRHAMAIRQVIKVFLADFYINGKRILGQPIEAPYSEAKLGMKPHNWRDPNAGGGSSGRVASAPDRCDMG